MGRNISLLAICSLLAVPGQAASMAGLRPRILPGSSSSGMAVRPISQYPIAGLGGLLPLVSLRLPGPAENARVAAFPARLNLMDKLLADPIAIVAESRSEDAASYEAGRSIENIMLRAGEQEAAVPAAGAAENAENYPEEIRRLLDSDFSALSLSRQLDAELKCRDSVTQALTEAARNVQTRAQAEKFIKVLAAVLARYKSGHDINTVLEGVDLAGVLVRIRDASSETERNQLLAKLSQVSPSQNWQDILPALRVALMPETAANFIATLPNSRNIQRGNDLLLSNLARAMDLLPSDARLSARATTRDMMSKITEEAEDSTQTGRHVVKGPRILKRNLEIVWRLLSSENLRRLTADLPRELNSEELRGRLNDYFADDFLISDSDRGGYDAGIILDAARAVQENLRDFLNDEGSYIQLYGSFPNGKARLKSSDVDTHLSDDLAEFYEQVFGRTMSGMTSQNWAAPLKSANLAGKSRSLAARAGKFQKALLKAEKAVGRLLHRAEYDPTQLLTMLPGLPFDPEEFAMYNPIVFKLTRSNIFLQVYDVFSRDKLHESKITP